MTTWTVPKWLRIRSSEAHLCSLLWAFELFSQREYLSVALCTMRRASFKMLCTTTIHCMAVLRSHCVGVDRATGGTDGYWARSTRNQIITPRVLWRYVSALLECMCAPFRTCNALNEQISEVWKATDATSVHVANIIIFVFTRSECQILFTCLLFIQWCQ